MLVDERTETQGPSRPLSAIALDALPEEVAGPVLAGVRARGVADLCETVGLPAILVDSTGAVLHVNRRALGFLGDAVTIVSDHLAGSSPEHNLALQDVLGRVLGAAPPSVACSAALDRDGSRCGMLLTAFHYADPSPYQRLKAVLVLGDDDGATLAGLDDLARAVRF